MEANTIKRKVDDMGRMVIPNDMRKLLGIASNDVMQVYTDGESVIITPMRAKCPLCKKAVHKGQRICDECISLIYYTCHLFHDKLLSGYRGVFF